MGFPQTPGTMQHTQTDPLPGPSGPQAQPSGVRSDASQWLANVRSHPLEGEGEEHVSVLLLRDIAFAGVTTLLVRYDLRLALVDDDALIPGSYWGEPEAGIVGNTVYARGDTPVHSLLHEAAHLIVLPPERRAAVHTDATDSVEEEDAVCILQVLLGDALPGVGRARVLADMDAWGYTFRLGSARTYFEHDADAAWQWLQEHGLVDSDRMLMLQIP